MGGTWPTSNGYIMGSTWPMMVYHGWYSAYNGNCGQYVPYNSELLAVLFAHMSYMAGTHGYEELHGCYLVYGWYKREQGAMVGN